MIFKKSIEGLTDKVTFKERSERSGGVNYITNWGKREQQK